jgi:hypothetical protein
MSIFDDYRARRRATSTPESVGTLEHMDSYFSDEGNWTQSMYANANGARCLVGAANFVRVSPIDDAKHWVRLAIAEVAPGTRRIEDFNDSHTFAEVKAVIARARQLALAAQARALLPAPAPVVEVLPRGPVAEVLPPAPRPVFLNPAPRARSRPLRSLASWIME